MIQRLRLSGFALFPLLATLLLPTLGCGSTEEAVKEYLEKNPQVLQAQIEKVIKEKGLAQARPQEKSIDEMIKNPVKIEPDGAPTEGPANAPITIIEFSDFQCPFCKRVVPTMKELMQAYPGKIRLAFRQNPLPFHKNAMSAAKASLAAGEQGKFWQMHDALFENQQDLSDEGIKKLAQKIGLNMKKFEADWKSDKFDKEIQDDMNAARTNGATGTPAFFINGVLVKGARPLDSFKEVVDKLLGQGAAPKAG